MVFTLKNLIPLLDKNSLWCGWYLFTDVCLHLAQAHFCILKVMLCWSRCCLLTMTWTWFMVPIKGHDHAESGCYLLPLRQLHWPEHLQGICSVLEGGVRSRELQENIKPTNETNKRCQIQCTPSSNTTYPILRGYHKPRVFSKNCHGLDWKAAEMLLEISTVPTSQGSQIALPVYQLIESTSWSAW